MLLITIIYQPHNYLYYNVQFGVQIYINPTESRKHFSFGNDELTSGKQKINFPDWICRSLPYSRNIDNRFRIKYRLIRKIQSGLAFSLSQSAEFKGSHVKDDILKTVSTVKFDVDDGPAILFWLFLIFQLSKMPYIFWNWNKIPHTISVHHQFIG